MDPVEPQEFPPPQVNSPGRWNKGRAWEGVGPWCDDKTSEETCRYLETVARRPNITIAQLLDEMVPYYAEKRAITYLDGKGKEVENHSYGEVLLYVRRIAAYLQREVGLRPGDRAVLLYPPGQEFILGYLGCMYAGLVAVPVSRDAGPSRACADVSCHWLSWPAWADGGIHVAHVASRGPRGFNASP